MSSDVGCILRKRDDGKFVVQRYWGSADNYPAIDEEGDLFADMEEAIRWHESIIKQEVHVCEYGLTVQLHPVTRGLELQYFTRKTFTAGGVRVTDENFQTIVDWTKGQVGRTDKGSKYIRLPVAPWVTAPRHHKAFIGDWVVEGSKEGTYASYSDLAFKRTFE